MKLLKYIILVTFIAIIFIGCSEQDEYGLEPEQSVPGFNFRMNASTNSFNLFEPDAEITLTTYTETSSNIDNVSILIERLPVGATVSSDRAEIASLQGSELTNDGSVVVTTSLRAAAEQLGLTVADLNGGDVFTLYNIVTLNSGQVYPDTVTLNENQFLNVENPFVTASATTSFTSNLTFPITCPSDPAIWEGTYNSEITASNYGGFVGATNQVEITFVGPEPFRYQISDISALAYAPFGGTEYPGDIFDICEVPVPQPTNTFGNTTHTGGSTIDLNTGIITLNYFEDNNGLSWTIVFTPI